MIFHFKKATKNSEQAWLRPAHHLVTKHGQSLLDEATSNRPAGHEPSHLLQPQRSGRGWPGQHMQRDRAGLLLYPQQECHVEGYLAETGCLSASELLAPSVPAHARLYSISFAIRSYVKRSFDGSQFVIEVSVQSDIVQHHC